MDSQVTLTRVERTALRRVLNLADGHSRPEHDAELIGVLERSYRACIGRPLDELEADLVHGLLVETAGQSSLGPERYFFSYSASSATEIIAKYLFHTRKTVGLIEPCFDNIPEILQYLRIKPSVIREEEIGPANFDDLFSGLNALWIVMPNNPTSWTPRKRDFELLVEYAARQGMLLIIDACFRHYSDIMRHYDQYQILEASEVDYIIVEDTGKTWASEEIKVGITATSRSLMAEFRKLHEALLLRVSPFLLEVITNLVRDETNLKRLKLRIERNRRIVRDGLKDTSLSVLHSELPLGEWALPLAWVDVSPNAAFTARQLVNRLEKYSVHVLPGAPFYWASRQGGERSIRLALNRETNTIQDAMSIIRERVLELE